MEEDIVITANQIFYKWDNENIKLTLETNPKNSLDTEIICPNQGIKTQVYKKAKNLPVH